MASGDHPEHCTCSKGDPRNTMCPLHGSSDAQLEHGGLFRPDADDIQFRVGASGVRDGRFIYSDGRDKLEFSTTHTETIKNCKKFHGILNLSEEVLLEALGIHNPNVSIKGVQIPFGMNNIQIQLVSSERQIDAGSGNVIDLQHVYEGNQIPVVEPHEDEEQTETVKDSIPHGDVPPLRFKNIP